MPRTNLGGTISVVGPIGKDKKWPSLASKLPVTTITFVERTLRSNRDKPKLAENLWHVTADQANKNYVVHWLSSELPTVFKQALMNIIQRAVTNLVRSIQNNATRSSNGDNESITMKGPMVSRPAFMHFCSPFSNKLHQHFAFKQAFGVVSLKEANNGNELRGMNNVQPKTRKYV